MKVVAMTLGLCALGAAADIKVGAPAPPLVLAQALHAPEGTKTTWEGLRGNSVLLEFWATWCEGCRDQIPHLNRLAEQFRGKPLRFLSVTDEEPEIVERFLKDYPISGWIGIDSGGRTFRNFGIHGRPAAALVDANGILRGLGMTSDLTGDLLETFLEGKPIAFSMDAGAPSTRLQSVPEPLFETTIRPAAPVEVSGYSPGARSGKPGHRSESWGLPLRALLSEAYPVPEERIDAPDWAVQDKFDVALAAADLTEVRRGEMLRELLANAFQLKVHQESRQTAGYVLRRRESVESKLRPGAGSASSHWGKAGDITAAAVPVSYLAWVAKQELGRPVFDETGLQGHVDFELKWTAKDSAAFIVAVRDQLGLDLVAAERPLEYLVVDSATRPRSW